jgi:dipeptidyl aminopeptidase/acylaminoacyl peptidase
MSRIVCLAVLALEMMSCCAWCIEEKRPITARDCVAVRDLLRSAEDFGSAIKISPDGKQAAYPVRSPDLSADVNRIEIYVKSLNTDAPSAIRPVIVGDISSMRWTPDGTHLSLLIRNQGRKELDEVDPVSGARHVLARQDQDIVEYTIDRGEKTVVYATDVPIDQAQVTHSPQEIARGYRIPFQDSEGKDKEWLHRRLYIVHWAGSSWSRPEPIVIRSPLDGRRLDSFAHGSNQSLGPELSPDGTKVLFAYSDFATEMPDEWLATGHMKLRQQAGMIQSFRVLIMYDLTDGKSTVPFKTTSATGLPLWNDDSKTFIAAGLPAAGTRAAATASATEIENGQSLYSVDVPTGDVKLITSHLAAPWEGALYRDGDGSVFVRVGASDRVARFDCIAGAWVERGSIEIPLKHPAQVATNGRVVLGSFSDTVTPPQLFVYRPNDKSAKTFAVLNPQFDQLTLATPKEVHWETSAGYKMSGVLLLPPGYVAGQRYSLVIQTKPFGSFFTCSFGDFPSFAPQPIANAGIMYLGVGSLDSATKADDRVTEVPYPKNYPGYPGPGGVAEAAFNMDVWDSAVDALDSQGLIDKNRVGIIGFSRTGWYAEFILAHSKHRYRAATATDNVQYSLGEYWMYHDAETVSSFEHVYGGPPYGTTLKNWQDYSVSFNLDKIHTPLLMEEMGNRITDEINDSAPPVALAASYEVFAGLSRLGSPVELYFYPKEDHQPNDPQARWATMQRNVDWYRFWLQGYERPDPEDPGQYLRWRRFKVEQNAIDANQDPALGEPMGKSPSAHQGAARN